MKLNYVRLALIELIYANRNLQILKENNKILFVFGSLINLEHLRILFFLFILVLIKGFVDVVTVVAKTIWFELNCYALVDLFNYWMLQRNKATIMTSNQIDSTGFCTVNKQQQRKRRSKWFVCSIIYLDWFNSKKKIKIKIKWKEKKS